MKKLRLLVTALLLLGLLLSMAGCGSGGVLEYINYGTGVEENGNYNKDLFMQNGSDIVGADPGCFFVSEEEDPEYGGYYYMYLTGYDYGNLTGLEEGLRTVAYMTYRSKDLNNWDACGVFGGYSLRVKNTDWCSENFWAPEVIRNPADGLYYMYFSAGYSSGYEGQYLATTSKWEDRMNIGIAVSETPVGPFEVLNAYDETTGNNVPPINFRQGFLLDGDWPTIDASPFFDDDGTLYIYFNRMGGSYYNDTCGVWAMRMKSMTEPEYTSARCVLVAGYESVTNDPGVFDAVKLGNVYYDDSEGMVNEGPFMLKHNGKYYLTYSSHGYGDPAYSVHQAISDDPLTGFVKLDQEQGNPVLNGMQFNYMNGTGHASFARSGDDIWIIYHRHDSIYNYRERVVCADRVQFVENADGLDVLTANGPSLGLTWRSEAVSGYANLALDADISIKGAENEQYLNDEVIPFYSVTADMQVLYDEDIVITLKWDEAVQARALMIYNANLSVNAFSKVADIRMKTTEEKDGQPVWKVIQDLEVPERYYDDETTIYMTGAPAVAEFDTLEITELRITLKASDKLLREAEELAVSEIVVLGGKTNG